MFNFEITNTSAVEAFNRLIALNQDMSGPLMAIGEVVTDFTKQRFVESADPYGTPWAPNSDTTLRSMLHGRSGRFTKKGKLSAKGGKLLAGKKPLIGESKTLSTQIHSTVIGGDSVTVAATAIQAAMQHFGGDKSQFPHLWGDIPERPIFPDPALGLPDELDQGVTDVLRTALENAIQG
jgi:phage gpG-like protein